MIRGKWFSMGSDISVPIKIRQTVFGRGEDSLDASAWHVTVYDGDHAVGAGRLWWRDGAFRIGDLCVLEENRSCGFGDLLTRLLLFKCLTHNASEIRLTATDDTLAFFEKYGFQCTGDEHEMLILGKDVRLSHCGGNCAECGHQSEECIPKALR